jgi:hypothetical protein
MGGIHICIKKQWKDTKEKAVTYKKWGDGKLGWKSDSSILIFR